LHSSSTFFLYIQALVERVRASGLRSHYQDWLEIHYLDLLFLSPFAQQYVQFLNIVSAKLLDDPACAQFFFDDIPEKDKEKVCCVTITSHLRSTQQRVLMECRRFIGRTAHSGVRLPRLASIASDCMLVMRRHSPPTSVDTVLRALPVRITGCRILPLFISLLA
jgi:hypothetical protein